MAPAAPPVTMPHTSRLGPDNRGMSPAKIAHLPQSTADAKNIRVARGPASLALGRAFATAPCTTAARHLQPLSYPDGCAVVSVCASTANPETWCHLYIAAPYVRVCSHRPTPFFSASVSPVAQNPFRPQHPYLHLVIRSCPLWHFAPNALAGPRPGLQIERVCVTLHHMSPVGFPILPMVARNPVFSSVYCSLEIECRLTWKLLFAG